MEAPTLQPRRLSIAFFTVPGLHHRWEAAFQDAILQSKSLGLRADIKHRQEVGYADLVILAYQASEHGTEFFHGVLELALRTPERKEAPRLGIAACERSDGLVTSTDIARLPPLDRVCYPARLLEPAEVSDEAIGWIQVTAHYLGIEHAPTDEDGDDGSPEDLAIKHPTSQKGTNRAKWY